MYESSIFQSIPVISIDQLEARRRLAYRDVGTGYSMSLQIATGRLGTQLKIIPRVPHTIYTTHLKVCLEGLSSASPSKAIFILGS